MYPNQPQQNLGFYVPPPMLFTNQQQNQGFGGGFNNGFGGGGSMADMLNDIMRSKPAFKGDIFTSPVYQSKYN